MENRESAYRGCFLGLAIGDAMGYTVDRKNWEEIKNDYGPNGLLGYDLTNGFADVSCPKSAGTLRSESEVIGTLRFLPQLEMRPSSNAPNPVECREAPPTSSFPDFSEPP